MKLRTWLAIGWTAVMLVLCWMPPRRLPMAEVGTSYFHFVGGDKIIHAGIFAVFAVLWRRATSEGSATVIAVSGLALAVITELGQASSLVGRDADLWDGVADTIGLLIGLAVGAWLCRPVREAEPASIP